MVACLLASFGCLLICLVTETSLSACLLMGLLLYFCIHAYIRIMYAQNAPVYKRGIMNRCTCSILLPQPAPSSPAPQFFSDFSEAHPTSQDATLGLASLGVTLKSVVKDSQPAYNSRRPCKLAALKSSGRVVRVQEGAYLVFSCCASSYPPFVTMALTLSTHVYIHAYIHT